MGEVRALQITKELKGMPVISSAARPLGVVTDAIVQPTESRLLGLLLQTPQGAKRAVATDVCLIFARADVITTSEFALVEPAELSRELPDGVRVCRDLIGTNIVTEMGALLGKVDEVLLIPETAQLAYHVAASALQRLFGGGFYLAGNVPRLYSRFGSRLIVPAETQACYIAKKISEAMGRGALVTPTLRRSFPNSGMTHNEFSRTG